MRAAVEEYGGQVFPFWWREDVTTVQRLYQFLGESLSEEKIETAQEELASRVLDGKQVEECHLDTTNYCTYVRDDTEYLRIGKSKDGVVGRRLVGLSLALTEEGLPILSTAHPGNRHDSKLFEGLFKRVCQRIESAGSDLEEVTIVFDRGFDDGDNFDLTQSSDAHVVAGTKRNRVPVKEKIDDAELDEFQLSHETDHGKCYVRDSGRVEIGEYEWRVVLSYHNATREEIQGRMREAKEEAEDLLEDLQDKITSGGRGRPITEEGIERKLREVLGKWYESLDWSFEPEEKSLKVEGWNDKWNQDYEKAGVHAIVTDHEDWSPSKIARTYFDRNNIESMFHLTKKALVVPVEPPYVKEDHLVRAHLFLVFVGLLCYQHIRQILPDNMTSEKIKSAIEELRMIIAIEDESPQFKLANVNERTESLLSAFELEEYLPE